MVHNKLHTTGLFNRRQHN